MPVIDDACEFCGGSFSENGLATQRCLKCAEERDAEVAGLRAEVDRLRKAKRPRTASEALPTVLLETSGHVARASGEWCGVKWQIHAELESEDASRGGVWIESVGCVADITVHRRFGPSEMSDETQAVLAAILWSALRALSPATEATDA